jgi:hypothetical protein
MWRQTEAQLQVVAFLGSVVGIAGLALAAIATRLAGRRVLAGRLAIAAIVWLLTYVVLLGAAALASRNQTLAAGEEKYFCEIDCHLAYRVTAVATASEVGPASAPVRASGVFHLVTLQTRFDETTIAGWRPRDVPLSPNPRQVWLVDREGKRYRNSAAAEAAVGRAGGLGSDLATPLLPGASYTTTLVFDLPAGAVPDRLLLAEQLYPTRFLIGHELSPFHGKTFLPLPG